MNNYFKTPQKVLLVACVAKIIMPFYSMMRWTSGAKWMVLRQLKGINLRESYYFRRIEKVYAVMTKMSMHIYIYLCMLVFVFICWITVSSACAWDYKMFVVI